MEFQTPDIDSPDEYRGFWITGEINADGHMEIKVGIKVFSHAKSSIPHPCQ